MKELKVTTESFGGLRRDEHGKFCDGELSAVL